MRTCSVLLAAAVLAAAPAGAARVSRVGGGGPLADYALGRLAFARDDLPEASRRFARALAAEPDNADLRARAFETALFAGDESRARALAMAGAGGEAAAMLRLADAFARARWSDADARVAEVERLRLGKAPAGIARAWARFARGDREGALKSLDPASAPAGASALVGASRARMLAALGRWAEAKTAYAGLVASGLNDVPTLIAAADAAARAGDAATARDLLGARESAALEAARRRLAAGGPLLARAGGPGDALAAVFAAVAGEFLRQGNGQPAVAYARLAIVAAPNSPEARLLAADALRRAGQPTAAGVVLAPVLRDPLWAGDARALSARIAIDAGARDVAIADYRAGLGVDAGVSGWGTLGELLTEAKRPAEAAAAFERAIELAAKAGRVPWGLWFQRGGAYEAAGDFARAEPDLRQALALAPREPIVLNYLGYALADRGLKLDEATRLLEEALRRAPNSAAIQDSVGWAYFKLGRFEEAATLLERAADGEPADASLAEHLGDVYWRTGRQIEARHRWAAAAAMAPEPAAARRLAAKLDWGLDRAALADAAT